MRPHAYLDYAINRSWSHSCIQVVPSRQLADAQLPYLGSGRYRVGLIFGCAMMLSKIFA